MLTWKSKGESQQEIGRSFPSHILSQAAIFPQKKERLLNMRMKFNVWDLSYGFGAIPDFSKIREDQSDLPSLARGEIPQTSSFLLFPGSFFALC